ncbi:MULTISPECIES: helix-turn-helix domain-containing protein [Caproicibacterium]|uniref:Helix-turn-helix transcriptional regulator n=1 Tax=Caproicibacterium argilliputei TaxID=3030016 RepID=A0AA97H3D2_9FIRM|nr:helix-turn-helix transcriptional regulator [Caproicibacterium argilliputei]WOC33705.1 helix-turn-helix transcriptional regulator [Caproicibacterium argilliputei]
MQEEHDLTQAQIGAALGLPQRTYASYKSGQHILPPEVLSALADYYGVSTDYLLGRTKNPLTNR